MPLGTLLEVIVYVCDMPTAVNFYRDRLGLPLREPFCDDYRDVFWVVFDTGNCKLCLHGGSQGRSGLDAPKIVFQVEDMQQTRDKLLADGVPLGQVRTPAPGVLVCDGKDPDGNSFSIECRVG